MYISVWNRPLKTLKPIRRTRCPRGSIYTTIMELGPQNQNGHGLLGANSIIVVYMEPLGVIARVLTVLYGFAGPGGSRLKVFGLRA